MYITEEKLLRKNNNFDLLRLIAALFVLFSHTYGIRNIGAHEPLAAITGNRYLFSRLGLILFFSMSGFLVCRSLITAASLKNYLRNRFLRIWPAFMLCNLLTILCLGLIITTLPPGNFLTHFQTLTFFFRNMTLFSSSFWLPGVFDNTAVNASIWTIPVEVRLYTLILLVFLLTKFRFRQVLLFIWVAVWAAIILIPGDVQNNLLQPHLQESIRLGSYFLAGACFYLYKEKIPFKILTWLVLFAAWISLAIWLPAYRHLPEQLFFVYSLLWMATSRYKVPFIKADYSYGIYLYAYPIQKVMQHFAGQYFNFIEFLAITTCCIFIAAAISWHIIEKKALSYKFPAFKRNSLGKFNFLNAPKKQANENK